MTTRGATVTIDTANLPTRTRKTSSNAPPAYKDVEPLPIEIIIDDPDEHRVSAGGDAVSPPRVSTVNHAPEVHLNYLDRVRIGITDIHLTKSVDTSYFWGRAGQCRIMTMIVAMLASSLGMPGFYPAKCLVKGYYESVYIILSLGLINVDIAISVVFIYLLLNFREVRCQAKWVDWNMKANSCAAFLATISGIFELIGTYYTRQENCLAVFPMETRDKVCRYVISRNEDNLDTHHDLTKLNAVKLIYKDVHYSSAIIKFIAAFLYSACARIYLKNDDF